ncbi:hypothetical protein LWI29_022336 [Acer saccharum]|uniref:Uncharacterized protein n=1 Tax=Acer saccharum TaxID=4024 RepID=A0AA39TUR6_ACESA|nr:hypothetical protein LWI29_022336 [Acer saccharum]
MPAYAKFFKELNSKARKKEFLERIVISKEASVAMETALPPKMKDPGSFIITISVGETRREKAMLDLGASINLMPYALFKDLGLEGLKPTTMELILADRSVRHPTEMVEDVLVRVGELIIPADFVILEMETDSTKAREMPILLGRPFMSTAKAIIDVHKGRLSMTGAMAVSNKKNFRSTNFCNYSENRGTKDITGMNNYSWLENSSSLWASRNIE